MSSHTAPFYNLCTSMLVDRSITISLDCLLNCHLQNRAYSGTAERIFPQESSKDVIMTQSQQQLAAARAHSSSNGRASCNGLAHEDSSYHRCQSHQHLLASSLAATQQHSKGPNHANAGALGFSTGVALTRQLPADWGAPAAAAAAAAERWEVGAAPLQSSQQHPLPLQGRPQQSLTPQHEGGDSSGHRLTDRKDLKVSKSLAEGTCQATEQFPEHSQHGAWLPK